MLRNKTHNEYMAQQRERYEKKIDELKATYYDEAYEIAKNQLKSVLRELLVDTNYEIFIASDSQLRGRIQAFFSSALAYFHERSEK